MPNAWSATGRLEGVGPATFWLLVGIDTRIVGERWLDDGHRLRLALHGPRDEGHPRRAGAGRTADGVVGGAGCASGPRLAGPAALAAPASTRETTESSRLSISTRGPAISVSGTFHSTASSLPLGETGAHSSSTTPSAVQAGSRARIDGTRRPLAGAAAIACLRLLELRHQHQRPARRPLRQDRRERLAGAREVARVDGRRGRPHGDPRRRAGAGGTASPLASTGRSPNRRRAHACRRRRSPGGGSPSSSPRESSWSGGYRPGGASRRPGDNRRRHQVGG